MTDFKETDLSSARESVLIGGLPFEVTDLHTAVRDVVTIAAGSSDRGLVVRLFSAYSVTRASQDHEYRELVQDQASVFPTEHRWHGRCASEPALLGRVLGYGRRRSSSRCSITDVTTISATS